MKYIVLIFSLLILVQCQSKKYSGIFPKYQNYVSDYDDTLTPSQEDELNGMLSDYERKTNNEIAIVSYSDENITHKNFDDFALQLSNKIGIGNDKTNQGLTIVYSENLRAMRISTTNKTQRILTDSICEKILNQKILPEFRNKNNYFGGLKVGVQELMRLWKN